MSDQNNLFVKTKLTPPDFHSTLVQRETLLQQLESTPDKRLCLICAPAGYGKTSFMAQYYQQLTKSGQNATWLSLDKYDADLGRFLLYVIYAIRNQVPDFADSLASILLAGFSDSPDIIRLNFGDAISTLPSPIHLFIDDFHLADTPEISALLKEVLLSTHQLYFVISTRYTPQQLPISRLRMLDQVHEILQDSLRFSSQESSEFFEQTLQLHLHREQVNQLSNKAEGWVTDMQLASISLRNSENADVFIKHFTGEHRSVGDFLGDEILDGLDLATQEFLLKCSLLPRFNYKLCDAIFGIKNSIHVINELRKKHLFIISLDNTDYWFRFHHLFSQYLRKKIDERHPELVSNLHTKASHWYESQGFLTDAVEHAIESSDHHHAADILDKISAELFYQGKISMLENYADAISEEAIHNHPSQQLDRIWQWIITWRFDKARIALSQVREFLNKLKDKEDTDIKNLQFLESKYAHREMSFAFFSDSTREAKKLAEQWLLHHLNDDLSMVSSVKTMLMVAECDKFILHDTIAKVDALHDLHVEANFPYGVVKGDCLCGTTLAMQGRLASALYFFERANVAALQLHGEFAPLTAMPCLQISELNYEFDELDSAEALVKKYLPLSQGFGFAENIIAGYLTKARLEFSKNPRQVTLKTIESGRKAALTTGFERLRATMHTEHTRQLLICGDKKSAFALARAVGISGGASGYLPRENSDRIHLMEAITWTRINVAMNSTHNAIRVLTHWVNHLKERGCTREAVRCAIILADIHYGHEDPISGRQYLSYALGEAVHCGFCRMFVDEGPSLTAALKQYKPSSSESGYTDVIRKILTTYNKSNCSQAKQSDTEKLTAVELSEVALTDREKEILNLCFIDKSNAEIAEALSLTEGTVKWYWQNIFAKLGVRRRRQAAILASDMGLIGN